MFCVFNDDDSDYGDVLVDDNDDDGGDNDDDHDDASTRQSLAVIVWTSVKSARIPTCIVMTDYDDLNHCYDWLWWFKWWLWWACVQAHIST